MSYVKNGLPSQGLGGGALIGSKASAFYPANHTETNSILDQFGGDGKRMWLGMIQYWNQYDELPTPLLKMTELNGQVLETPGFGAYLDYVTPYKLRKPFVKYNLTDSTVGKPAQGGTYIPLVLSAEYAQGDVLTNDKRNGVQIRVHQSDPIVPYGQGDGWLHYVTIASNDPDDYIPWEVLEPGTTWFKIDNRSGEFGIHSSGLTQRGQGLIMQSYKTANSEISVSHSITSWADQLNVSSFSENNTYMGLYNYANMSEADKNSVINFYNIDQKTGKPIKGTNKWMPTVISKMIEELALMKEHSLTWSKGFSFKGEGGQMVDVPTGYYHQVKERGVYFQYNDTSKLMDTLKGMVAQLFAGRKNLKVQDRRVKFTMGFGAYQEAQKAFGEYARATNPFLIVNDGKSPITNGIFTGSFQNLTYRQPRVVSVEFPEVGLVEIEHNAALDYMDDDNEFQHYHGLLPNSSYMIWVEDLSADEFSNAIPRGATWNVKNGVSNNVVQLRPQGYEDTITFFPGRGFNPTLNAWIGQSAKSQVGFHNRKGFEVEMSTCGEIFIKDPSRIVLGEFVPKGVHIF